MAMPSKLPQIESTKDDGCRVSQVLGGSSRPLNFLWEIFRQLRLQSALAKDLRSILQPTSGVKPTLAMRIGEAFLEPVLRGLCIGSEVTRSMPLSWPIARLSKMMDPKQKPFDGKRMYWGGFKSVVEI
jgi:hypothetical protein